MGALPGRCGAVAEWSKALAWKVSIRQNRIEGSNPSRSASLLGSSKTHSREASAVRPDADLEQGWVRQVQPVIRLIAVPAPRHHPAAVLESPFLHVEELDVLAWRSFG